MPQRVEAGRGYAGRIGERGLDGVYRERGNRKNACVPASGG